MSNRADDFNRSDGNLIGSTPSDGGSPWVGVNHAVESNRARCTALGYAYEYAFADAASAVGRAKFILRVKGQTVGPAMRAAADGSSYLVAFVVGNQLQIHKRTSPTTIVQIGPTYSGTISANDEIEIEIDSDDKVYARQNGVLRIGPITDAFNSAATYVGDVCYSSASGARWDDFSFTDLAGGGATLDGSLVDDAASSDIAGASLVLAVTLIDGAAGADVVATTSERAVTLLEAASAIELCTAAATRLASLIDSAVGAETLSAGLIANATLLDAATAADLASAVSTLQVQLTEAASAADLLTATRIANAAVQEAAAASDTITTGTTYAASTVEAAVTADALSAATTLVVQLLEAGTVLDQLNAAPSLVALLTEAAAGTDLASAAVPQVYSVTALELAAALDLLHAAMGSGVTLAPGRRQVAMPSVQQLQRTVQMPAVGQLRRAVALYPS